MGMINNECVIATGIKGLGAENIREWISKQTEEHQKLFAEIPGLANDFTTFILAPNGSKKGWPMAKDCDKLRCNFINFMESFKYDDGSNPWKWVEVGFGERDGQQILSGNSIEEL